MWAAAGGMGLHATRHHGVDAVGVTLSARQADWATRAVTDAGLGDRVQIRRQDYRHVVDGPYDAIRSIGMFERVGLARLGDYFARLHRLLRSERSSSAGDTGCAAIRRRGSPCGCSAFSNAYLALLFTAVTVDVLF